MESIVLGTAGHVDHGKTALIRALTSVDLDHLAEEKRRGITIELGFTRWVLPGGRAVGVIDVPGHESFVKTMVAGAAGIHLVLLVVAADEGVMPQTREHVEICRLLGVRQAVVALTKRDLVDDETAAIACDEVREFLAGTPYAAAPVVEVSAVKRSGLDELAAAVARAAAEVERGAGTAALLRLPVDRSFVIKGFGTVVTGTLLAGRVELGDELEVLPGKHRGRVRGLEVHGESVEQSLAGQRTAVNLAGLSREQVPRGSLLAHPGQLGSTRRFDAELDLLPGIERPLKDGGTLTVHAGTRRVGARMRGFGGGLGPGRHLVRIELLGPLILVRGDRFVLRGTVPRPGHGLTLGGGRVLDPAPPGRRRFPAAQRRAALQRMAGGGRGTALREFVRASDVEGAGLDALGARLGEGPAALEELAERACADGACVRVADRLFDDEALERIAGWLAERVAGWDGAEPPTLAAVGSRLPRRVPSTALPAALERAVARDLLAVSGDRLALSGAEGEGDDLSPMEHDVLALYEEAGLTPPRDAELLAAGGADPRKLDSAQRKLHQTGRLVRVKDKLSFSAAALEALEARLLEHLEEHGAITTQEFKAMTGLSRKFLIPLAEYFDRQRLTLRVGDKRVLRKKR